MICAVIPVDAPDKIKLIENALNYSITGCIELRLEYLKDVTLIQSIIDECAKKNVLERALVSIKPWWEGGKSRLSDEQRIEILKKAQKQGAKLIEIEMLVFERLDPGKLSDIDWSKTILSVSGRFEEMNEGIFHQLLAQGKGLGVYANKAHVDAEGVELESVMSRVLWFLSECYRRDQRCIVFVDGVDKMVNIAAYTVGSAILYVYLNKELTGYSIAYPTLDSDVDRGLLEAAYRLRFLLLSRESVS